GADDCSLARVAAAMAQRQESFHRSGIGSEAERGLRALESLLQLVFEWLRHGGSFNPAVFSGDCRNCGMRDRDRPCIPDIMANLCVSRRFNFTCVCRILGGLSAATKLSHAVSKGRAGSRLCLTPIAGTLVANPPLQLAEVRSGRAARGQTTAPSAPA